MPVAGGALPTEQTTGMLSSTIVKAGKHLDKVKEGIENNTLWGSSRHLGKFDHAICTSCISAAKTALDEACGSRYQSTMIAFASGFFSREHPDAFIPEGEIAAQFLPPFTEHEATIRAVAAKSDASLDSLVPVHVLASMATFSG